MTTTYLTLNEVLFKDRYGRQRRFSYHCRICKEYVSYMELTKHARTHHEPINETRSMKRKIIAKTYIRLEYGCIPELC